jgi:hypothetical protein
MGALDADLHINIEDQIVKYPDPRRELLKRLNGKNFKSEVKSHKYEWTTRDNRPIKTTLALPMNGTTSTQINVVDPGVLNKDDIFRDANGVQFVVESVSGGVVVNFRKLSGTQTALAGGAEVTVIGGATPQGADADNMVSTGTSDMYNYVSNFEDVVELSDMENEAMIRGEETSAQLIARKQMELSEKLQNSLIAGIRTQDSARKVTTMGGIKYMIDTYASANKIDFGGDIWATDATVEGKLDDAFDIVAAKAFDKPVMYVGAKFMRKFKFIQDDTVKTEIREKTRGVGVVKTYQSHLFGDIDVVLIQERAGLMDDLVIIADESLMGYKPYRNLGWHTYPLAKTGQSYKWQVAGVYTFKMDIPEACVYLHNLGL